MPECLGRKSPRDCFSDGADEIVLFRFRVFMALPFTVMVVARQVIHSCGLSLWTRNGDKFADYIWARPEIYENNEGRVHPFPPISRNHFLPRTAGESQLLRSNNLLDGVR